MNYPSHRFVSLDKAKKLTSVESKSTFFCAVLVNPNEKELDSIAQLKFHYYQIYGDQDPDKINEIKKNMVLK